MSDHSVLEQIEQQIIKLPLQDKFKLLNYLTEHLSELPLAVMVEKENESEGLTEKINAVCKQVDTSLDPLLLSIQIRSLPKDEW